MNDRAALKMLRELICQEYAKLEGIELRHIQKQEDTSYEYAQRMAYDKVKRWIKLALDEE